MNIVDILDEYLDQWLEKNGDRVQELYGIDGYLCVMNFVSFIKEKEDGNCDGY